MGQNTEPRNKPIHMLSIHLWQSGQERTKRKQQSLQQMVLEKLGSHMWKNEIGPVS